MFGVFARNTMRGAAAARPAGRRFLSGESHEAHHVKTMDNWRKISYLAVPLIGGLSVINVIIHMSHGHHEHDEEHAPFTYLKIRSKKFPWECSDCGLFDRECHRKCRRGEN
mmetsp:Transcript_11678/g.14565  ORF Transcript_11678/g.14565 Transcript_11678/m.14565 type:complete len:111 (-) Transcript_11678:751-1083(-)